MMLKYNYCIHYRSEPALDPRPQDIPLLAVLLGLYEDVLALVVPFVLVE